LFGRGFILVVVGCYFSNEIVLSTQCG